MNNYKINCVGMTDEQKRLVQDAFFKLGYWWINGTMSSLGEYAKCNVKYLYVDDREMSVGYNPVTFMDSKNTEITFNELMKLANMEGYMTFTKADLKDGMVTRYRGGCHYSNKYNGLNLVVGQSIIQADEFSTLDNLNDDLNHYDDDCLSIVEVFEVVFAHRLDNIQNWQLKSIWKRPEQTPQQKALADLEAKQQELIDQAEKIKADIAKLKGM